MKKTITLTIFALLAVVLIAAFITAESYTQLGIATLSYPILAYFAFKLLPTFAGTSGTITISNPIQERPAQSKTTKKKAPIHKEVKETKEGAVVVDIERRAFLKVIGGTGLSLFIFLLLGRRVDNFISNGFGQQNGFLPGNEPVSSHGSSPLQGYNISEIDEGVVTYYGFVNVDGGWLIMKEDTNTNSFRYKRGSSDFPSNWEKRQRLDYDYYHNLF